MKGSSEFVVALDNYRDAVGDLLGVVAHLNEWEEGGSDEQELLALTKVIRHLTERFTGYVTEKLFGPTPDSPEELLMLGDESGEVDGPIGWNDVG